MSLRRPRRRDWECKVTVYGGRRHNKTIGTDLYSIHLVRPAALPPGSPSVVDDGR